MLPPRLIVATSNVGKLAEFESLLAPHGVRVEGLKEHPNVVLPDETGATYADNARLKAETAARATGLPVLGDDSGLEVDALGGRPGLYSARFAQARAPGETQDAANRRQLLAELRQSGVAENRWTAHFVCALAYAGAGGQTQVFERRVSGIVIATPRGGHGFGYDPLLLLPELGQTFAEIEEVEKNRRSHRALAVLAWIGYLTGGAEKSAQT